MGRSTVELFVAEGAFVAALDVSERGLAETVAAVETPVGAGAPAGSVSPYVCDVADAEALVQAIDAARAQLGPIDILVNNAGVSIPTDIEGAGFEAAWNAPWRSTSPRTHGRSARASAI